MPIHISDSKLNNSTSMQFIHELVIEGDFVYAVARCTYISVSSDVHMYLNCFGNGRSLNLPHHICHSIMRTRATKNAFVVPDSCIQFEDTSLNESQLNYSPMDEESNDGGSEESYLGPIEEPHIELEQLS